MITVVLAEDQALVRQAFRLLLETFADIQIVGEAADGAEALRLMEEHQPNVALLDLSMPGLHGLETVKRARRKYPATRILVLSGHANEDWVQSALTEGAAGYLLKGNDTRELELALRTVARGETYVSPQISHLAAPTSHGFNASSPLKRLTSRQREVLQLVTEGQSTKAIAARIGISTKTVEAHRAEVMRRLEIRDVAGLVRFAIRTGLISEDQ